MRMLVFNDPHLSPRAPASRKAEYTQQMLRKLREIVTFAIEQKVDILACTGDWFISKKPENTPYWLIVAIEREINRFRGTFLSVIGNHDCETVLANFTHSPLYTLFRLTTASYNIDSGFVVSYLNNTVSFAVCNYDKGADADSIWEVSKRSFSKSDTTKRVMLLHGPIVSSSFAGMYAAPFLDKMVRAEAIAGCCDYLFYGDIHDYHGVYVANSAAGSTVFCNLGSIARNTARELQRNRPVLCALFDSETGEIQQVELEDVDPIEQVFRSEEIAYDKFVEGQVDEFTNALNVDSLRFTVLTPDVLKDRIQAASDLTVFEKLLATKVIDTIA